MNEIEVNINSYIFKNMISDLNNHIQSCLKEINDENFQSGDISLKLTIEAINSNDKIVKINEDGVVSENYIIPIFNYKTSLQLKKKYDNSGNFANSELQLIEKDGKYLISPVKDSQINIMDFFGGE